MSYPNTDSVEHLTMYMTIMTNIAVRHVLTGTIKIAYEMTQHEENSSIINLNQDMVDKKPQLMTNALSYKFHSITSNSLQGTAFI